MYSMGRSFVPIIGESNDFSMTKFQNTASSYQNPMVLPSLKNQHINKVKSRPNIFKEAKIKEL